jgi:hypothetical protein
MIFGLYLFDLEKWRKKVLKKLGGWVWLFYFCIAFKGRCLTQGIITDLWGVSAFYTEGSLVSEVLITNFFFNLFQ